MHNNYSGVHEKYKIGDKPWIKGWNYKIEIIYRKEQRKSISSINKYNE